MSTAGASQGARPPGGAARSGARGEHTGAVQKIDIAEVGKRFATDAPGTPPVLGGITLAVAENEFVVLLGRSGCGKTTLLNIIAGLEQASAGAVRVDDAVVTRPGGGKGKSKPAVAR